MRAAMDAMGGEPYVVQLYETYEGPSEYFLVMEVVSGGEVYDRIKKKGASAATYAVCVLRPRVSTLLPPRREARFVAAHRVIDAASSPNRRAAPLSCAVEERVHVLVALEVQPRLWRNATGWSA